MGILFLLSVILYVYLGYPIVLWLAGLARGMSLVKEDITPTVSLIIPAYNEEKCIAAKIDNSLSLDYPKDRLEIIIGSDGSIDDTNSIVRRYEHQGVILSHDHRRAGKSSVLMRCVKIANGEIVIFSDADSILEKDSLKNLVKSFADPSIGCVEGVRRDIDKKGLLLDSLYWNYETMLKKLNSRIHSLIGATGAIFAVRRTLYSPINTERGDDFEIPIRVVLQGYGSVLEPSAIAYHPWLSNKDEFGRIVRIVSWMMPSAFILLFEAVKKSKWLLAFQLISHKILRWCMPIFMILLFTVNTGSRHGLYGPLLLTQVIFYSLAVAGYICDKFEIKITSTLKIPYFFCLINCASLVGMFKLAFGRSEINWMKTARDGEHSGVEAENKKLRIFIITQDEPFYLPIFYEDVFSKLKGEVVGISILPEGKSIVKKLKKYLGFYGPKQFYKKLILYILYGISDIASCMLPVKKLHSVRRISRKYSIPIIVVKKINGQEFLNKLKELKIDLVVSVASPQIFQKRLIEIPPLGCINIHGAPLPKYRGMLPSFWMLFNGEKKGAVTVHYIDERIDSGDIILQKEYDIEPNITHHDLIVKSKKIAAAAVIEAISLIKNGKVERKQNNPDLATYYTFPKREEILEFQQRGGKLR